MQAPQTLIVAAALTPMLAAQSGVAGSETAIAPAQNLPAAGGRALSTNYQAATGLAFSGGGTVATSPGYQFRGGAVWTDNGYSPPGPAVFGVLGGGGTKDGGQVETVFGTGFQSGGPLTVTVGGQLATSVNVLSDTEATFVTPQGVDVLGNPLGLVDVAVDNGSTASTATGAYRFEPALEVPSPLKLGQPYKLAFHGSPGSLIGLYNGAPLAGFALPINGLDGAFDLVAVFFSPVPTTVLGAGPQVWSFPLPDDPILAGKAFQWQGFEIDSFVPLGGSFTNRLATPISY